MKREVAIDSLRTVATLLVILLHCSSPFVVKGIETFDGDFWTANIIDSFTRICVPLFVMISGRYLLSLTESDETFYRKRLKRIGVPLLFWSLAYTVYTLLGKRMLEGTWDFELVLWNLARGIPHYHIWYLFMILGLYAIAPVLRKALAGRPSGQVNLIATALILLGIVIDIWDRYHRNTQFFGLWFIPLLGYFVFGFGIAGQGKVVGKAVLICTYVISSALIAFLTYLTVKPFGGNLYFYSYLSPLVIVGALSFYMLFDQMEVRDNILARLSGYSLGVYVVHAALLDVLNFLVFKNGVPGPAGMAISIQFVVTTVGAFSVAYLISKVPLLRKTI